MKKIIFVFILALIGSIKTQAQDIFLGYWTNEGRTQIIKIYKEDSFYYGQIMFRRDRPLKEIKNKILAVKDIRLAKFFKRDLPKTVKEFLINFFTTYNNDHATIYVDRKDVQTTTGRRRSLGDIYKICKYYYPNVTLTEVVKLLFKDLQIHFKTGFRHSYCGVINKRVFYYSPQETNFEQDTRADEYGKNLEYYKSKV